MGAVTAQTEDAPAHAASPRGASWWLGLVLVVIGAGVLGYVGWLMYGTNYLSRQAHERTVEELQQDWSASGAAATASDPERVRLGDPSALIRIPRFGDDYVVPVLEGVSDEVLASGYGHFPATADPGRVGNYALAAHRITHGEPLRDMPELRPGDEVIVEIRDLIFTYQLDTNPNELIVPFEEGWVVDSVPTNPQPEGAEPPSQDDGQRLITLTTCAELFHTDERMIAFGHLVDTRPK